MASDNKQLDFYKAINAFYAKDLVPVKEESKKLFNFRFSHPICVYSGLFFGVSGSPVEKD